MRIFENPCLNLQGVCAVAFGSCICTTRELRSPWILKGVSVPVSIVTRHYDGGWGGAGSMVHG